MNPNSIIIKVDHTHIHSTLYTEIGELIFFSNAIQFNKRNTYRLQKNLSKLERVQTSQAKIFKYCY